MPDDLHLQEALTEAASAATTEDVLDGVEDGRYGPFFRDGALTVCTPMAYT